MGPNMSEKLKALLRLEITAETFQTCPAFS